MKRRLFHVFAKARERANTIKCISNMPQIGVGCKMYADDNDETYPLNRNYSGAGMQFWTWKRAIQPYLKSYEVWLDPAIVEKYPPCYFTGGQRVGDESNLNPKFATDKSLWIPASYAYAAGFFHEGSSGVDGHVTTMKLRDTVVPIDLWKHHDYPYSQVLGWVNNMAAEYK